MIDFRIFYADGTTYTGPPENAPSDGVQVIAMPNPDGGIMTCAGSDFYVVDMREGDDIPRWYGTEISGLHRYLKKVGLVKYGWHIGNRAYRRILTEALRTEF